MRGIVNEVIERLLETSTEVSTTDIAKAAGISRQAAHKQLRARVEAGQLLVEGKARKARYRRAPVVTPLRVRLEVASAGSSFRLSARLLLDGLEAGEVTLDFTGITELGEEFLEEVFLVWAPSHPRVSLRIEHVPSKFAPLLMRVAKTWLRRGRANVNRAAAG